MNRAKSESCFFHVSVTNSYYQGSKMNNISYAQNEEDKSVIGLERRVIDNIQADLKAEKLLNTELQRKISKLEDDMRSKIIEIASLRAYIDEIYQ